ncbi:MAG: copper-binding protein [Phycisphaeraceae bacterium]
MKRRMNAMLAAMMLATMSLTAGMIGCSDRSPPEAASPPPEAASKGASARSYTVRGEIVQLPGAGSVDSQMLIRHEAIPDFVDDQGKVVGMMSMTMPFPVATGVSLEGLKVGDAIQFTFELDWKAKVPYQIVKIEKLAGDVKLNWGR